jgi:hypothetical protein
MEHEYFVRQRLNRNVLCRLVKQEYSERQPDEQCKTTGEIRDILLGSQVQQVKLELLLAGTDEI